MKTDRNPLKLAALAALVSVQLVTLSVSAQEVLPREEALKYAFMAALHEPAPAQAPIRVDADLKRPFVGYEGEYGVLALPETKISAAAFQALGKDVIPVGQLWLRRLTPMAGGSPVGSGELQVVRVQHEGESARVPMCLLGARRTESGGLELLVYGRGKEPLVRVPLAKVEHKQTVPIEVSGERDSDSGRLQIHLVGQYRAEIQVTEFDE